MIGDSLLSIKEFSELTGIKQTTLRYFDELGVFTPAERSASGYRYYSPQQIITINAIKVLGELELNTRQMASIESNRTPESMLNLFMKCERKLEDRIRHLQAQYDMVRTFRRLIHIGTTADEHNINVAFRDDMPIVMGPDNDFSYGNYFYEAFLRFCDVAPQYKINLNLPVGGSFENMEDFVNEPREPKRFFSIDPSGGESRPAGNYLIGYTRGYYGESGDLPARMVKYAKDHDLQFTGPVYNIFVLDEISVQNPKDFLLEVSVQVTSKK
jgi:DNA-binding transcriptional MerR regulator